MKTRQITTDAALAAMCAVLGGVSLELGNFKISFESLPILVAALMFGAADGLAVGGIGTLIYQLLRYGVTVTTPLWILPYALGGLLAGVYAERRGFRLETWRVAAVVFSVRGLILILNTVAMYADSKVYGYYSAVYIFGSLPLRLLICLTEAAAFTAVLPGLLRVVSRVRKKER